MIYPECLGWDIYIYFKGYNVVQTGKKMAGATFYVVNNPVCENGNTVT